MTKNNKLPSSIATLLLMSPILFTGCDSFRNTFGLDHYSPDEMSTATPNPSLIIPPDCTLRPPRPGAENPGIIPDSEKAKMTVLGNSASREASVSTTKSEKNVIEKVSENQTVTPNIRTLIDEESQTDSTVSGKVISKIKSWKKEVSDNLGVSKTDPQISDDENRSQKSKMENNQQGGDS